MLGVITGTKRAGEDAKVFLAEMYGKRKEKFAMLDASKVAWKEIELDQKMFFFADKNNEGKEEYESFIAVNKIFPVNVTGIVTARDGMVIDTSREVLLERMQRFADSRYTDEETRVWLFSGKKDGKYQAGDSRGWKLTAARKAVALEDKQKMIQPISYRPFDTRYIYYSPKMVDWGRFDVMQHFLKGENLGLVSARGTKNPLPDHFYVSKNMTEAKLGESSTQSYVFPLYLYHNDGTRTPNFDRDMLKMFTKHLTKEYTPEHVLDYIYAVLHSPKYRETYKEFLKIDFPRVPAPVSDEQFHRLAGFGKQLRELHLLTSPDVHVFATTFPNDGSNVVDKLVYKDGKVFINAEQYFGNVPVEAWEFYIGGYQPAQKWLKDRKGQKLTNQDIEHYQQMIVALVKTGEVMKRIDEK